jgi:ParB-like chromosome segregation protein Spo0J
MKQSGLVNFHDDLTSLLTPIDLVRQHPENYNNGDIDAIVESIEVNGMYRPIYVQRSTAYIVAGNHTWLACKMLEADEIPVVYVDIDDHEARKILVADNRVAALARPDDSQLLDLLDRIAVDDGLHGTGYNEDTLEALRLLQQRLAHTPLGYPGVPAELGDTHVCPACGHTWHTKEARVYQS